MKLIALTHDKFALVDEEDYEKISLHSWCAYKPASASTFYALSDIAGCTVKMHRLILNAPKGIDVDHINGDGLDNRRSNLRLVTRAQNQVNRKVNTNNTSGYRGVSHDKQRGKWRAFAQVEGKTKWIGHFNSPEEAYAAFEKYMREVYGEYYNTRVS